MRSPWILALLVATTLGGSSAAAVAVDGEVGGTGPFRSEGEAAGSAQSAGVYVPNTAALQSVLVESAHVHVTRFEARYLEARIGGDAIGTRYDLSRADFDLHDVRITLVEPRDGWLGGVFANAPATFRASGQRVWSLATDAAIGNEGTPDQPNSPTFRRTIEGATFGGSAAAFAAEGTGQLKWLGPTLQVEARENATTWKSGTVSSDGIAGTRAQVWYLLDFEAARIELESADTLDLLTRDLALEGLTSVSFTYHRGELDVRRSQEAIVGEPGQLAILRGSLAVAVTVDDARARSFRAHVTGDVTTSTLAPTSPLSSAASVALGGVALALAAGVGGVGVWLALRRREGLGADEWAALAEIAADEGRYADALHLVRRARAGAPTSLRLATTEAHFLALSGDAPRALDAFRAIADTEGAPEAEIEAARLLLAQTPPRTEEAARRVARALDRSPALLLELEGDAALETLRDEPEIAMAIRRARRAVDRP